jgi:hypothetical protein
MGWWHVMGVNVDTRSELVSGVSDLQRVPLSELVRTRAAQLNRTANPSEAGATAGEFNSSI